MSYPVALAFLFFAYRRLLTYLHIYQQEEYDSPRFIRWLIKRYSFDMRASLAILIIGAVQLAIVLDVWIADVLIIVTFLIFAWLERSRRARSKKPLVMTARATRIYWAAFGFLVLTAAPFANLCKHPIWWIIPVQAVPFALTLGNLAVSPFEQILQKRFWNEAHAKLLSLKPVVDWHNRKLRQDFNETLARAYP